MGNTDPKILFLALVGGMIPALLWLWFWIKEDNQKPEPRGLLAITFIIGMIAVAFVIPLQKFIKGVDITYSQKIIVWAGIEEIIKYIAVIILLAKTNNIDEPVDWPIYLITAALGFAAAENALFLLKPLSLGETTVSLLTGQMRFLGSTLLHAVTSALIGISLGLSFRMGKFAKKIYFLAGGAAAIALHSTFNFFIMNENDNSGIDILRIMGFLWVVTVIVMLLFEKLRRMGV